MVHHPYSEHYRKQDEGDIGIDTQKDSDKKVQDATSQDVAFGGEIIGTRRGDNKLRGSDEQDEYSEQYADDRVALEREDKDCNASQHTQQACDCHQPPMLDDTARSSDKVFKMIFHNS